MGTAVAAAGIGFQVSDVSGQKKVKVSGVSPGSTVRDLVSGLLERMRLPHNDSTGRPLNYRARSERKGTYCRTARRSATPSRWRSNRLAAEHRRRSLPLAAARDDPMAQDDYRYSLDFFREDGSAVGQVPVDIDWEPAMEWTHIEGVRSGRLPA